MTDDLNDAAEIRGKTHDWINTLLVSGVSETAAVTGAMMALSERALVTSGAEAAAAWLEGQARLIRDQGPALLKALKG